MKHFASPDFWAIFKTLPLKIQHQARKNYGLLKEDPQHRSLHFKKIGQFYSVRISRQYRALGVESSDGILWFWIGSHADYDKFFE